MTTKRGNPIQNAVSRVVKAAKAVDTTMMNRMPADFQKMQKLRKKGQGKTAWAPGSDEYNLNTDNNIGFSSGSANRA